jgi:hypothetical protein
VLGEKTPRFIVLNIDLSIAVRTNAFSFADWAVHCVDLRMLACTLASRTKADTLA